MGLLERVIIGLVIGALLGAIVGLGTEMCFPEYDLFESSEGWLIGLLVGVDQAVGGAVGSPPAALVVSLLASSSNFDDPRASVVQ